LLKLVQTTLR